MKHRLEAASRARGVRERVLTVPVEDGKPKLLDQLRQELRSRHYSLRTEESYIRRIGRFIYFHGKRHPSELSAAEINGFLTGS